MSAALLSGGLLTEANAGLPWRPLPVPFALHAALATVQAEHRRHRIADITRRADAAVRQLIARADTTTDDAAVDDMLHAASLLQQMALLGETMALALQDADAELARTIMQGAGSQDSDTAEDGRPDQ